LAIILIGAIIFAALLIKNKEKIGDEAIHEGTESTMKQSETASESGNYSKI